MQFGQVAQKSDLLCNNRAPVLPTFVHTFFIKIRSLEHSYFAYYIVTPKQSAFFVCAVQESCLSTCLSCLNTVLQTD